MNSDNLQSKLARFGDLIAVGSRHDSEDKTPERYIRMAQVLGGELHSGFAGSYCLVRTTCRSDYIHGQGMLAESCQQSDIPVSAFTLLDKPGSVDISSLLFLDTETTGLGGTGAVAFLVGCGSYVDGVFEVRQYLIPDYSDETAMLEALQEEFSGDRTIVTYNGASFDLPLLRGRMIVNRVARDIDIARHIDLLHATRRLFRRRLSDCTLVNVERELLGFFREDDIPGYLIPSIYFDWLSEQRLDGMNAVLQHNRFDIVSLCFLVGLIGQTFQTGGAILDRIEDLHSLARVYNHRKETDRVVDLCRQVDERSGECMPEDIILFHSLAFKKADEFRSAVDLWGKLSLSSSKEGYRANLELAKFYEHKAKDFTRALNHARLAEKICPYGRNHVPYLRKRLNRIASKIARE